MLTIAQTSIALALGAAMAAFLMSLPREIVRVFLVAVCLMAISFLFVIFYICFL